MKILVVQQKMIGDVLTSTLLCEYIKKNIPNSQVHYLINTNTVPVVTNNPYIDQVVLFTPEYRESKLAFYKFLKSISKEHYDVVVDVYSKLESNLVTLFSGADTKISYEKWYSKFIYTHTHKYVRSGETKIGLAIENRLSLLKPIFPEVSFDIPPPKIYLTQSEKDEAKVFLEKKSVNFSIPILMINVLGSSPNKTYPLPFMAQLLDNIAQQGEVNILFNYIPSQIEEVKRVYELCSPKTKSMILLDVFAPSLRTFLGLLFHCNALVGNEGGAVNMAKALEIPAFSIFSPWITKVAWETFPNNTANKAVHLEDFLPHHLEGKPKKQRKKEAENLYSYFEPTLFTDQLKQFLEAEIFTH
ncbi:glycosyltransferase family 9 protein [Arenibacter latericius]|uniref:glycosyltransferase family 9 protein n=1 Tax=Arenibacter latericius TaxID=86104 RepID=UPI0003FF2412|nr:glycosyltransferase family 9 protein [Arenibacter latericius]MDX1363147.1 glycosyltransferase family 9 protein [Arenibacter latericius]